MENKIKRFLSLAVAVIMIIGMLPGNVFAAETTSDGVIDTVAELQAALDAGGTVTLGGDIDLGSTTITFPDNTPVTIDLNGHTLSRSSSGYVFVIDAADNVTITGNGSVTKAGGWYFFDNYGKLRIEGGNYEKSGYDLVYANDGAVTEITGGTFVMDNIIARQGDSTATISGGNFTVSTVETGVWGEAIVTGGTFKGVTSDHMAYFLPEGYTYDASTGAVVAPEPEVTYAVKNETTGATYDDLASAIAAASANDVLVLYADVDTMPTINKPLYIKGAEGKDIQVNCAIAENFPDIDGTVIFENLTFNDRISTENASSDQSKMTLRFQECTFNVPAGTYAIQGGSTGSDPDDVLGGLFIDLCDFTYAGDTYTGNYMVYAQCVLNLTVKNSSFDGKDLYKGAIHTGDSIEQATSATLEWNTIKGFARGVQIGNRVEISTVSLAGNEFSGIKATSNESKSGAVYLHSNANAEATDVKAEANQFNSCDLAVYNDGHTNVADLISTFDSNTDDGETLYMDAAGNISTTAPTPAGPTEIDLSQGSYTITEAGEYVVLSYTGANTLTIQADANVELQGVNITAAEGVSAISIESGNVTLNVTADSTLTGGKGGAGVYVAEAASVTVKGGKLTAIGNGGADTSDSGAAGIGGTYANGNSGAITIDGATVVAEGYGVHGSGIGSGSGKVVGEIQIINGAIVTAYGGYYADGAGTKLQSSYGKSDPEGGAGIGGGGKTASTIAKITISDSTVTAYGGSKAAGIGANFWCSVSEIVINGNSNVTAYGGSSSAGIGTSRAGDTGVSANITISGGTVNATGGAYGSGIGGGYNADSLGNGADASALPEISVTISGGTVTATGGEGGAAIGGGYKTDNVNIDITGGTVTATAGALVSGKTVENGGAPAAIGSGANGSGTFENSPAAEIASTATVTASAYYGGKNAVEGTENNAVASNVTINYLNEVPMTYVAQVGETKYTSLQDAINAAQAGDTVKLIADVTLTADNVAYDYNGSTTKVGQLHVAAGKNIILDLNGYTLQNAADCSTTVRHDLIVNEGTLKIVDNGTTKGAIISNNNTANLKASGGFAVVNLGTMTIEGVTIDGNNGSYAVVTQNNGSQTELTITDATLSGAGALSVYSGSKATINSGTFSTDVATGNTQMNVVYLNSGNLTIKSGTFNGAGTDGINAAVCADGASTVTIEGGEFTGKTYDIQSRSTSVVNVSGGTFHTAMQEKHTGASISLTGGTYSYDPTTWVAKGYKAVDNGDGTWSVEPNMIFELHLTDANGEAHWLSPMSGNDLNSLIETGKIWYDSLQGTYDFTLKILESCEVDETVLVTFPMTIDLCGNTITTVEGVTPIFRILSDVTVKNGTIDSTSGAYGFIVGKNDGTAGNLTIESGVYKANTTVASVTYGTLTIEGGEFSVNPYQGSYAYLLNCVDRFYKSGEAKIVVTGGTFHSFDPENNAAEGTGTDFVPESHISIDNGDGTYTVMSYVEWVKAELLAGNDVTLDRDITITDYDLVNALKLPSNGNGKYTEVHGNGAVFHVIKPGVVLDLNGHSIVWDAHHDDYCNKRQVSLFMVTATGVEGETAELTVKDSVGTGKVDVYGMGTGMYVVCVGAEATIEGGTWTNHPCNTCQASNIFLYPSHGGKLYITGGTFEQKESEYLLGWKGSTKETTNNGVGVDYDETLVEITGGNFVGFNPEAVKFFDTANSGQETINGCADGYVAVANNGIWTVQAVDLFDIAGANMHLGNSLAMNFFIDMNDLNGTDYYAVITHYDLEGTRTLTIPYSEWETRNNYYMVVTLDALAARQMADTITVVIYNSDGTVASNLWTDSVRDYAMRIMEKQDAVTKTVLVDMLNYGAAAQIYFKYNTEDLANNKLSDAQKNYATQDVSCSNELVKGDNYFGSTLTLKSNILLTLYFKNITPDMYAVATYTDHHGDAHELRIEGSEFSKYNDNVYGVIVDELVVADGNQLVTVTVYNTDGTVAATASDSMNSYLARNMDVDPIFEMVAKFTASAYANFHKD